MREGIPSPTGNPAWHASKVRHLLSDIRYTGKGVAYRLVTAKQNGKEVRSLRNPEEIARLPDGTFPQITTSEEFASIQKALQRNQASA
jgi:hypothetical protein